MLTTKLLKNILKPFFLYDALQKFITNPEIHMD